LKYLIAGLGNIGDEYQNTRHNVGFTILDTMARISGISFSDRRYGFVGHTSYRGRKLVLLKPTTFMNLSGNAVNYWLSKEKIPIENLLVIVDDISLPLGNIRLRKKGGDGGHNGLFHISSILGRTDYARLRFGIGNQFNQGQQSEYVLGKWTEEELSVLPSSINLSIDMINSYCFVGIELTMTRFNKRSRKEEDEEQ